MDTHGSESRVGFGKSPEVPDTEAVVIAEMSVAELNRRTAAINPATGAPMTRLEEISAQEAAATGGRIFTQIGDRLSEASQAANRMLHSNRARAGAGAFVVAVIAIRQVRKNHTDAE